MLSSLFCVSLRHIAYERETFFHFAREHFELNPIFLFIVHYSHHYLLVFHMKMVHQKPLPRLSVTTGIME